MTREMGARAARAAASGGVEGIHLQVVRDLVSSAHSLASTMHR